jgi:hypothetical protein
LTLSVSHNLNESRFEGHVHLSKSSGEKLSPAKDLDGMILCGGGVREGCVCVGHSSRVVQLIAMRLRLVQARFKNERVKLGLYLRRMYLTYCGWYVSFLCSFFFCQIRFVLGGGNSSLTSQ